ncbi:hypothetical protein [Hymenobacter persicinus]|uniref:Uncharacterized protein n=1 Tax=Hymenobacter persicinus TaxID=2025506 RepID=A0A4Q5LE01_9BACT|nr:hypothetical protein [Hymenobacter persicinus]RYU80458.1 hypothetical protein EWM57_08155 [Hymenobacter persicinus]
MKKIYTTACLLLTLGAPVLLAQNVVANEAALHSRVTSLSRRIAETAKLSEGQYVRVKRLNLVMMSEMETIKARFAAEPVKMDEQLAELQARYDWDLAAVLQPRQLAAYNEAKISTVAVNAQ